MLVRMIGALTSMTRRLMPVRLVAILCAAAIVAAGFAHSIHQNSASVSIFTMQADSGASDDLPDTAKKVLVVVEHCFGCMKIAVEYPAQQVIPSQVTLNLPVRIVDEVRPHKPLVEIPPPRFAI